MYRVLIADDEPIERMIVNKMIQEHFKDQLEVVQAINGREAIKVFEEKKCEIVILDIEMPGISGLEAAEMIRQKDKNCSIVFLTAFDYFTYAKKAITVKALDYLLKPSSDEELMAVLEEAIRLSGEQDHNEEEKELQPSIYDDEKTEPIKISVGRDLILEYIKAHYMEDISLQDVAREMNYSDAYFCKLFRQYFDKSFTSFLSEFRLNKAKQLLMNVKINVKEISNQVGYHDSNYFGKVFKRAEGMTPNEYRMRALENMNG